MHIVHCTIYYLRVFSFSKHCPHSGLRGGGRGQNRGGASPEDNQSFEYYDEQVLPISSSLLHSINPFFRMRMPEGARGFQAEGPRMWVLV